MDHQSAKITEPKSPLSNGKPNQVGNVVLYGLPIVSLIIENQERLCLAQISNTLLKHFSYNEIHNRRVALGITCVQCTPVQLEILRRAGAMPVSSRRCGMITRREAERLCKSFLGDNAPPRLPDDFAFSVHHECAWGCRGAFLPSRYNSSRAKCIKCTYCGLFFSPNKFIFHSHRTGPSDKYIQPDAANFNSWRRHMKLSGTPPDEVIHAWEDVKAMFNGGTRKRLLSSSGPRSPSSSTSRSLSSPKQSKINPTPNSNFTVPAAPIIPAPRVPPFPELPLPLSRSLVMDYVWHNQAKHSPFSFTPYSSTLPWLKRNSTAPLLFHPSTESGLFHPPGGLDTGKNILPNHQSAFRPVQSMLLPGNRSVLESLESLESPNGEVSVSGAGKFGKTEVSDDEHLVDDEDDDEVDIETTDDKTVVMGSIPSTASDDDSSSTTPVLTASLTTTPQWSPKHETISHSSDPDLKSSTPLNLSPKGGNLIATSVSSSSPLADRLWSISRITQQMDRSPPMHSPFIYRNHLTELREPSNSGFRSRSNSPISVKALDCTACHLSYNTNHRSAIENNNKLQS